MRKDYILFIILLVLITGCNNPDQIEYKNITGEITGNQVLTGYYLVTGDVIFTDDVYIKEGTVFKFLVQDDQSTGTEIPADGYNDNDPTKLLEYDEIHSNFIVNGKLVINGTKNNPVIFTSADENPNYADWIGISFNKDNSLIQYAEIEWSRHGIAPGTYQPNTVIKNNKIKHTFWGAISLGKSSAQAYNNNIEDCGHEGIDVQGNDPIIVNNIITNCHTGIMNNIMNKVGDGIHVTESANPKLQNNIIKIAPKISNKQWCYNEFAYNMFGSPGNCS